MTSIVDADTRTQVSASPLVRAVDVRKAFGATQAVRSATIDLVAGEVLAIIGENGSGKSTLVKILAGVHAPDAGAFTLPDGGAAAPPSPSAALAAGIVTVFQEVLVVGQRSVLDNVWLGSEGLLRAARSQAEKRERAGALLEELLGRAPSLDRPVETLSLSDRQACAIVRALVRRPKVLILDEATSALDVATRDRLFAIVGRLSGEGVGTIFISHRMDEIEELGDRITVMRSGSSVATVGRGEATMRELVRLMTGDDHLAGQEALRPARVVDTPVVLSAKSLTLRSGRRAFDFTLHAGELVGIAGLEGQGQDDFLHALRGVQSYGGEVAVSGADRPARRLTSTVSAFRQGIVHLPRERRNEAIFPWMNIRSNFALPTLPDDARAGVISSRSTERRLQGWVDTLGIKLRRSRDDIGTLSGGNQQKVILARWLASGPRVLVLNDPTRGVDIGAKRDIYDLLVGLSESGVAIVMLSTEVDEHVELMDRVVVFREHEPFVELARKDISRERLVAAFFGRTLEEDA
ncbi:MAG TPA: sugar ABC transporter ATP-binding protein [Gaiellaceae bacterium]|nr:sugar ABC transporter ATP-binding protein [Gaiellaceae bacterium]